MTDEKLLSVREVADRLNIPERTVTHLAASGDLVGVKVGRAWRFRPSDVSSYLQRNRGEEGTV